MLLMQSLNKLSTPEQKLEAIIKKHAELVRPDGDAALPETTIFTVTLCCSWRSTGATRSS